ncbi:Fe(3+) dicitrate ABC transporter substrate-binding protein [Vibrio quintilis]|uniref:Fe(3+)-citrate-binding protein YfmC n=1 Tax=Vibrio quintilis TaxID=1117707 RepID=A0A1M7YPW5_9VIBR|nr:Fe(3+) dicitrate ABC transporter substrate-binding protein [Vibrio quintilis]SHO54536.1 Fe(3+)-citrate-binding protein YfmC precursor [Vibrio quintilis]
MQTLTRKICTPGFIWLILCFIATGCSAAVTVEDRHGTFHLDEVPSRIVVLEFSFADALAAVHVSPVGIADDKDPNRLLPEIREQFSGWVSVGTRSQPSLEMIASLKPDLIIADAGRHAAVYDDLSKIAPTLLLSSRRESYEENLNSAAVIGKVIGKAQEMQARLAEHKRRMQSYRKQLQSLSGKTVQFGVARENAFYAHPNMSYAGGVIHQLGFGYPPSLLTSNASRQIGVEQLLALNPDYLIIGDYSSKTIVHTWQQQSLWKLLKAVQKRHVIYVNGNLWSRCRGILAAELMAKNLLQFVTSS